MFNEEESAKIQALMDYCNLSMKELFLQAVDTMYDVIEVYNEHRITV